METYKTFTEGIMKKVSLITYIMFSMIFLFSVHAWGIDYSSHKFTDAANIQDQIASGSMAKVIVILSEDGNVPSAVNWRNQASVLSLQNAVHSLQSTVLSTLSAGEYTMRYRYKNIGAFSTSIAESGLEKLINNPSVKYIQPVRPVCRATAQGLPLMNAIPYRGIYDGSGVSIAIVDDAVDYTHPSLGGGGFPNSKVIGGYDFGNMDNDPAPVLAGILQAHGTSVAGVAAGSIDFIGDYIGGAAPGAKIYALKFSNDIDGGLTNDGGVASWDWCLVHQYDNPQNPILVISNSWGIGVSINDEDYADFLLPAEAMAAARCTQAGMTVVMASGNEYFKSGIGLPAACSNTVAVGAVSDAAGVTDPGTGQVIPEAGYVMPYSNTGDLLDLFAPADCTYVTDIVGEDGYSANNWTTCFNGTSCATPYTSGMIAVLQQASFEITRRYLTPQELLPLLKQTGTPTTDMSAGITRSLINIQAAIDTLEPIDDTPPTPNPAEWYFEPQATGLNQIVMKAAKATDPSGVQYSFMCTEFPNDPKYNRDLQDSPLFVINDAKAGTTYTFRCQSRDVYGNMTRWSPEISTTTASGFDNLPPAPSPSLWESRPRETEVYRKKAVSMKLHESYDGENGVEYYFDCIAVTDSDGNPAGNPDVYDSGWQSLREYTVVVDQDHEYDYVFVGKARQEGQTDPIYETDPTETGGVYTGTGPRTLEVPYPYSSIQSAIYTLYLFSDPDMDGIQDHDVSGSTVVVHPGTYAEENIDFWGLPITVRSDNPNDPAVVAATIVDPSGNGRGTWDRAFIFQSGESRNSLLDGFTIQNAETYDPSPSTNSGTSGMDAYGGAIACFNHSSPTISRCVILNCRAQGQDGSDGDNAQADGENGQEGSTGEDGEEGQDGEDGNLVDPDSVHGQPGDPGGNGGHGGSGYGGAIYADPNSAPRITGCTINGCYAIGGNGGAGGNGANGGNGGDGGAGGNGGAAVEEGSSGNGGAGGDGGNGGNGGDGGDGGNGGNAFGGAIYFAGDNVGKELNPEIIGCTISNCGVIIGMGNYGGNAGNGGVGGTGGAGGTAGGEDAADGIAGDGGRGGDGGMGGHAGHDGGGALGMWQDTGQGVYSGVAYGGAIYASRTSNLTITETTISNNRSTILRDQSILDLIPDISLHDTYQADRTVEQYQGGNGGNGGAGGDAGNAEDDSVPGQGGDGGDGGDAGGVDDDTGVYSFGGNGGNGGNGGDGGDGGAGGGGNGGDAGNGHMTGNPGNPGAGGAQGGNPGIAGGFITFQTSSFGGGLFLEDLSFLTALDSTFSTNMAETDDGGGLYIDGSTTTTFTDCRLNDNSAADEGGGVCFDHSPTHASFVDCLFTGNTTSAGDSGGAIGYNEGGTGGLLSINGCTFQGNRAGFNGGSIWAHGTGTFMTIQILDSTFSNEQAQYGGAVCVHALKMEIVNCTFTDNIGEYGGAVFSSESDVTTMGSIFLNNSAEPMGGGTNITCTGGAMYCLSESVRVYDCQFAGNTAQFSGGAVYIIGSFDAIAGGTQDFVNCLMVHNTAGVHGGAFAAMNSAEPYLINSTITDNLVIGDSGYGGAISCGNDTAYGYGIPSIETFVFLENSIVWNNNASLGPQLALGNPVKIDNSFCSIGLSYTNLQGAAFDFYGAYLAEPTENMLVFDLWDDGDEVTVFEFDPRFTAAGMDITKSYYLSQTDAGQLADSDCVDLGTPDTIDHYIADLADFLGHDITTRTDHVIDTGIIDVGYHYFADPNAVEEYTLTAGVYLANLRPHGDLEVITPSLTPREVVFEPYTKEELKALGIYNDPNNDPNLYRYTFKQGTQVELLAKPYPKDLYQVARWIGTDDPFSFALTAAVTMIQNSEAGVEFELAVPKYLYIPESYDSIEDALLASRSGDVIVLAPRPDQPYLIENQDGLDFGDKNLILTSWDPNDPQIVARTVIDCQGSRYISKRAFHFNSSNINHTTRIEGITIRNAFTAEIGPSAAIFTGRWPWWPGPPDPQPWTEDPASPDPLPPYRALSGMDATGDSYGGAILCENGSSPTIRNCIFENCTVAGGVGGDGADGDWPANMQDITDDLDSQSGGHSGKGTGNGYGGAIAVLSGSNPRIYNCQFRNNRATGGWGGIPGDAGQSYNNGRFGWGGNDTTGLAWAAQYGVNPEAGYGEGDGRGGAIYVAPGCDPEILECTFENNYARPGYVSQGGAEGPGGAYPEPFATDPWGEDGARDGRDGILFTYGVVAGGAIYLEDGADVSLAGCEFIENQAYEVFTYNDSPVPTRGGAIYSSLNARLRIRPVWDENDPNQIAAKSLFEKNLSGALYCRSGADLRIEGTEFINNYTFVEPETEDEVALLSEFDLGGAITVEVDSKVPPKIIDCQFYGNSSNSDGGAIRTLSDIVLKNCTLNGNYSLGNGGGIYSYVPLPSPNIHTLFLTFERCEFSGNQAQGLGGAAFLKDCVFTMNDCFLILNKAASGGGLRVSRSELTMQACVIFGNEAVGIDAGAHRSATGEGYGGGLHITDSPFTIRDTRFEENKSFGLLSSGGGLCITGSQQYYNQILKNCLFVRNESQQSGGGVSCLQYVMLDIEHSTFADNKSDIGQGGGLYIDHESAASISDSIFYGNTGIGIYEKGDGQSYVDHALFCANGIGDMHNGSNDTVYSAAAAPGYTNIKTGDPQFASGRLGDFYLDQSTSDAIDAGSVLAAAVGVGLDQFTTDPEKEDPDTGPVDLGYHYRFTSNLNKYILTLAVKGGLGEVLTLEYIDELSPPLVIPPKEYYYEGQIIDIVAMIDSAYFLTNWSGGTFNDNSQEDVNRVLMSRDKTIQAVVRLRKTLSVGTSPGYDTLGDAISAAQDGDYIRVVPGVYTSASQFGSGVNNINLQNKKITISGSNPSNETTVRATIFRDFRFNLDNLGKQTVIEGITIDQSRMHLVNADLIIRNCIISNCRFMQDYLYHEGIIPAGTDGYHQMAMLGGAIQMFESEPEFTDCIFENNAAFGRSGENGFAGGQTHPTGGDGGWPSPTYGGAVYCGLSSNPAFTRCTFTDNEAIGGNGGNGAIGWINQGVQYDGGRGGGWVYDDDNEQYLSVTRGWDGWANNSYGDKYAGIISYYAQFYGDYDIEVWSEWFGWQDPATGEDRYASWDEFFADYDADPYDPTGDPYDQLLDVARYSAFGGAVYCEFDCQATFTECVFENNQCQGGLTGIGGPHEGQESPWPDRQLNMPTAGGAVYAAHDCVLEFTNCTFMDNFANNGTVDLPHSFHVSFGGGVAYEYDCAAKFNDCVLNNNGAADGGGIYSNLSETEIADCNLADNEAYLGAGFFQVEKKAKVERTLFKRNLVRVPVTELPDPIDPNPRLVPVASMTDTGLGGGIYTGSVSLTLKDSVLGNNLAGLSGGGLYMAAFSGEDSTIRNCLFIRNQAYRDGGGASINWFTTANLSNCTFADNWVSGQPGIGGGTGGGLFVGYGSSVEIIDSILWLNYALQGTQATVGSGFEEELYPSSLKITYSDVLNVNTSGNAIYVRPLNTLEKDNLISADPLFDSPEDPTRDIYPEENYYLDPESPCVNVGSGDSHVLGLDGYTTQVMGTLDRGKVDLGYHYLVVLRAKCSSVDNFLEPSGKIDIGDLANLLLDWLDTGCQYPDWCNGSDLNLDKVVDFRDVGMVADCWMVEEEATAPEPDPMKWDVMPASLPTTNPNGTPNPNYRIDKITMTAAQAHDDWWPDDSIEYQFVEVRGSDPNTWIPNPDNWQKQRTNPLEGLRPGQRYDFIVYARDGSGHETMPSEVGSVTPGTNYNLLMPNPSEFEMVPTGIGPTAIAMEAVQVTGLPANLPGIGTFYVDYYFVKTNAQGQQVGSPIIQQSYDPSLDYKKRYTLTPWYWEDTGLVLGQTYYYRTFAQLVFRDVSGEYYDVVPTTSSAVFAANTIESDLIVPTPNPAQWEAWPSHLLYDTWYHYMRAAEANDENGVEYNFVCVTFPSLSSGWQNEDNVAGIVDPDFSVRLPNEYWVPVYVGSAYYEYYIIVRDRSPNQNQTQPSSTCQAGDDAFDCPNLPLLP